MYDIDLKAAEESLDRAIYTLQKQWMSSTGATVHWRAESAHPEAPGVAYILSDDGTPLSLDGEPIAFRANDADLIVTLRRASFPIISILYEGRRAARGFMPTNYAFTLAIKLARAINKEDS